VECGGTLAGRQQRWCGKACVNAYLVRKGGTEARRLVRKRDRGVCALCRDDTEVLRRRIQEADREGDRRWARSLGRRPGDQHLPSNRYRRPGRSLPRRPRKGSRNDYRRTARLEVLEPLGLEAYWWRSSWWDMNHRLPVVLGGGGCGLDNLETLCLPCHSRETAILAARIAESRVRPGQLPRGVLYWSEGEALPRLLPQTTNPEEDHVAVKQSTVKCTFCGISKLFPRRTRDRKYCSPQCRLADSRSRYPQRFWAKVDRRAPGGCWAWTSCFDRYGYGQTSGPDGRTQRTHRIAWYLVYGEWPEGDLLHSCDTRNCVNPAHLRVGTHQENMRDAAASSRWSRKGENNARARLDRESVKLILALDPCPHSVRDVAKHLGVSDSCVRDVLKGRTWRHVSRDMDHVVAVRDGGGGCGLDGLRTLCISCHRARTATQQRQQGRTGG